MGLAALCVRRPVFATMLIMALVVLGTASFSQLGVDLFPKIDLPIVTITTTLPGASAEEMETEVTKPIEEAVNTIQGIDELRATTLEGTSRVFVTFVLEREIDQAAQDVRDKVSTILRRLPEGVDPPVVEKLDPDASPIMSVSVSGDRSLREITEIADKQIKQQLEGVPGIGQVLLVGGRKRAIQIEVDAEKLNGLGISAAQVSQALQRQNIEIPSGRLDQGRRELVVRTLGRISSPAMFGDIIVASPNGAPVRVRDFATVTDLWEEPRDLARLDGRPAVTLLIRKQSGTNTVKIIQTVKTQLVQIGRNLPPDVAVDVIRDQSMFIEASVHAIYEHLILGGLFASLVVLFFMRNLRATIISAIAIPTSIISAFTIMRLLGYTLNSMTLLGLTVSVGIVIDDAIVVLENIFRYIEEKHFSPMEAAVAATREIGLAVMATTLSLAIIFAPVVFLGGIPGRFLQSFGVTAAVSIMVSLLVSFTLTPMLSSRFIRMRDVEKSNATEHGSSKESKLYRWIEDTYIVALEWSLAHRKTLVLVGVLTFLSIIPLGARIGKDFFPEDDQDEFEIVVKTPEGTSLQGTDEILRRMEDRIRSLPEVRHLLTTAGSSGSTVTDGSIYVRLSPLETRKITQFEVMRQARAALQDFPSVRTAVQSVSSIGGSGFRNTPVNVVIRGPDLGTLSQISGQLYARMRLIQGMVDVDTSLNVGNPEVQVHILRDKASDLGVSVTDIARSLRLMISGEEDITKYKEGDELYEVRLRVRPEQRGDSGSIGRLMVPSAQGKMVRFDNVALIERGTGPAQIDRYNRQRQVTLSANLIPTKALGEAMSEVQQAITQTGLPPGYDFYFIGRGKVMAELFANFVIAFALSVIFMYMVLAAQFESFIHPITILASLPLAIPFALLSLFMTGKTLHMWSALGLLLLFGIVKKNSILQIDFINRLRREAGLDRHQAIIDANRARLRPILMTTLSIIAGMIPTALGTGAGAGSRSAIAVVIVGGQTLCFVLTLLAIPVIYTIFDDIAAFRFKEKAKAWRLSFARSVSGFFS
jgi:hydrophobic/amphiphilic exporter-1 (mainly G- bacteria), HAE1 family